MSDKVKEIKSEKIEEVIDTEKKVKGKQVEVKKSPQEELNEVLKNNDTALVNQINVLNDRITTLEVSLTAMSNVLDEKKLLSKDDINDEIEREQQRLQAFQQIQAIRDNYRIRLEMCKKWKIEIQTTNIVNQLKEDAGVSEREKLEIAAEHGIDVRLFLKKSN